MGLTPSLSHLRFITCGSVDDGKSTLIGRLLHDAGLLGEDQLAALRRESRSGALDYSLLVDGLTAEREQGITIDVAYRYFATPRRSFIVADTPGHEQYTRNMATGASTADAALILVDARKGVLTQTRRHATITHLLGIRSILLVVNKMDLVGWDEAAFDRVEAAYRAFAAAAGMDADVRAVPVSALLGENVVTRGSAMSWYRGPALLDLLETIETLRPEADAPFRMAVQWVNRSGGGRLYAGQIASGRVHPGDEIRVLPSGGRARLERIVTFDGALEEAGAGQSIALAFDGAIDCGRGDLVTGEAATPPLADRIEATIIWMAAEPMIPGRAYWLKSGTRTVTASIARVEHIADIERGGALPARPLALNEIGACELVLDRLLPIITYDESRTLGGFILIDRATNATVAAGLVRGVAGQGDEAAGHDQVGRILRLTGPSAAERARRLAERLEARGRRCFVLDGDAVAALNSDLAADDAERRRRREEVAAMMAKAGIVVLLPQ